MIEIYGLKLDRIFDKLRYERLVTCLPEGKRERVRRFHNFEDAHRTLFADVLTRHILYKRIKTAFNKITFRKNEYGKPFLKDEPNIHFNISHSGEWVVIAIHSLPIGIDVEQVKTIDLKIAERFFSKSEYNDLINKEPVKRLDYFYELWTLKESYIKAKGLGLSIPLDSFSIHINNGRISIIKDNKLKNYFFKQYEIGNGYKMAVCSLYDKFPAKIKILDLGSFYREICCEHGI